ncbi:MAG: NAD(+) synthase [Candidatus Bathyarchaeia archaeon]|nr:NAD(+) synthase [Candidatus Bathyarchaeota archaeon]
MHVHIPEDFTKFGDGACDLEPLADCYKTVVKQLAEALGIPKEIIAKPPSPDLWPDHQAKDELGADYELLDLILWGVEHWWTPVDIAEELGVSKDFVEKIFERWRANEHKRRPPLAPKLSYRTVGHDFRIPRMFGNGNQSIFWG